MTTAHHPPGTARLAVARWIISGAAVAAGLLALRAPIDLGYWWHLAVGRLVSVHQAVVTINPFVYTVADAPVVFQPWIGQFWLYELHDAVGLGVVAGIFNLLFALCVAAHGMLAWRRSGNARAATIAATLVGVICAFGVDLGPEVFGYVLTTAVVALCFAVRDELIPALGAYLIAIIAAFWVNLAPGFFIPAALAVGFALANWRAGREPARIVHLGVAGGLSALATLVNPRGVDVWQTTEDGLALSIIAAIFVGLHGVAPRFGWWAPPRNRRRSVVVIAVAVTLATAVQPWFVFNASITTALNAGQIRESEPLRGLVSTTLPVAAVEVVRTWGSKPRVFMSSEYSGYYLYEIAGNTAHRLVWRDAEDGLVPPAVEAAFITLETEPNGLWRGLFQQYGISAAILHPDRHAALIAAMDEAPDWRRVLSEDGSVLFQRVRSQNPPPKST